MTTETKTVVSQDAAGSRREEAGSSNTFEGKVVSITGDKLVMTNKEGKQFTHSLARDARFTCDGTTCEADNLKAGSNIRVTTKDGNRNVATCIEALDKNADFTACK